MSQKIDLIRQALSAAESSLKLARQLLSDLEKEGVKNKPKVNELPGITGIFDGQNMVTESGDKYPVPENYASKSILVVGDTLKLVEQGKEKRFKQVEHVKRHKTNGILTKKDGKWAAVTPEGSYKLLSSSIDHFSGETGDEVLLQIPANNLQSIWAAVEKITKKESLEEDVKETKKTEAKLEKDEKKEEKQNVQPKAKKQDQKELAREEKEKPTPKEKAEIKQDNKEIALPTKEEPAVPAIAEPKEAPPPKSDETTEDELM
ncbi:MAG: hypothetical protein Q8O75_00665 [bacterium]|nr:hypothetical protein [bacterium]